MVTRVAFGVVAVLALSGAPAHAAAQRAALAHSLGRQAVVDIDPATGTPRTLARLDGTLTAPSSDPAVEVAHAYVDDHLDALGITWDDLDGPAARSLPGGITQVVWRQVVGGIPSADSDLRVNVTADGRVLDVLGSPVHGLHIDTSPSLDAGEAVRAVQDAVGAYRSLVVTSGPTGDTRATRFNDGSSASLVAADGRLAWRVTYHASPDAVYDASVDASSGAVIRRANMVKDDSPAQVWERYPGSPVGGTAQTVNLETNGWLTPSATTLNGTNVHAFSDVNDDDTAQASEETNRTGGGFSFPFTSFTGTSCDAAHACSWSGSGTTWQTNEAQNATQAFYFANRFHDHLAAAPIGFGPAQGAFEGADKLQLNADDGAATGPNSAHLNNANMFTPPDGQSPTMQMYLFRANTFRNVNGGDDAAVLYHEYTHGLSNRLVTDAGGFGALSSAEAGAMGEAWSDWYAQDFIVAQFPSLDTAASGEVSMGAYEEYSGGTALLRTQPLDCPVAGADPIKCPGRPLLGSGGYTYADFGRIANGPEVHSDGEIWGETLWDLRTALGSAKSESLVTTGMALLPPEPSFLDARNGIILADQALFGGADVATIWTVFANRGMGFFAAATGGEDTSPWADFSTPPAAGTPTGTVAGTITDSLTGQPVAGATVAVAGLSGLGTYSAVSAADGRYTLSGLPQGTYVKVAASGPGYERTVSSLSVSGGVTLTFSPALRRDWASSLGGATVSSSNGNEFAGIGCGPSYAIDQSQASGWSMQNTSGKFVVVKLPTAVDVTQFSIDPAETCGDDASAETAGYQVATSPDGTSFTTAATGTFGPSARHVLNYLTPTAGTSAVQYVRLTITAAAGGAGAPFVDLTEFGVYGTAHATAAPPDTTITDSHVTGGSATFSFTSSVAGSTFECALDGGAFSACTSPKTYSGLDDGSHTFHVRATDPAGNPDPTPATQTFTVDTTPPDTFIDSGPGATVHAGALTFVTRSNDAGAAIACSLDGAAYGSCSAPIRAEDLALGAHVFRARATDLAGNVDPTPAEYPFTVVNAAPQPALALDTDTGPAPLAVSATIAGADADNDALTYTIDWGDGQAASGALPAAAPLAHTYATPGAYTVRLDVRDARTAGTATHPVTVTSTQSSGPVILTLGTPTALGQLAVGVAHDYTATVAATSTAPAPSALTVVDPSTTAPGHLVNGTYALNRALEAEGPGGAFGAIADTPLRLLSYPAAVANDIATITFRQHVDATDTLRSGTYAKTLTFTLSLVQP